jgi:hypothetical protein
MNQIETIDGIPGEWRTVTKASEVTVGQRVRYEYPDGSKQGYSNIRLIEYIDEERNRVDTFDGTSEKKGCLNLFNGHRKNIQAFFPLAGKPKRNSDSDCTNKSCRSYDNTMAQNCARSVNGENDEPYATICPHKGKPKRKVAKVTIVNGKLCGCYLRCKINGLRISAYYASRKSALRGARRFCKAIGYEMEVVK